MPDQPNVLMICADHWSASLFGGAGHPVIQSPTLDQIARNGVRFTNCYTECPVCIPARRTMMTGTSPRTHGDRVYSDLSLMPDFPTLAQCFRDAGYQSYASGKLHVYPQRDRIGFDDVRLLEEGRMQYGCTDDYEMYLGDRGYAGQLFESGMCNNEYMTRHWHLPEDCHPTNWTAKEMCRTIQRLDPTRPSFLYLSFCHPHPPLWPLKQYMDMYRDVDIDMPVAGEWSANESKVPYSMRLQQLKYQEDLHSPIAIRLARQAFYALCTHIDHQLRVVIGTLREKGLLDNTYILFTCDHGDMLGNHDKWGKSVFYENSANVPMIISGPQSDSRVGHHRTDGRICGLQDVMPTLLDLCGLDIPDTVDGSSIFTDTKREYLYGEIGNGKGATRMIRQGDYKLIYYAAGNHSQLFNITNDPDEQKDLAADPACADTLNDLTGKLISELYNGDEAWAEDGKLVGLPAPPAEPSPNHFFSSQRGTHWPPPAPARR